MGHHSSMLFVDNNILHFLLNFIIIQIYFHKVQDIASRPPLLKEASQASFDWNFSAPPSPTIPSVTIKTDDFEAKEDDEDVGMVFNFDKEENKHLNTKPDMNIGSNEPKMKQLSELKNQLNKTKQTLDINKKLQRYVVQYFNKKI